MTDDIEIVHVSFGPSRSDSIREALTIRGCDERVIALAGALNFGPINPAEPDGRQKWISAVLRPDPLSDRPEPETPWEDATADSVYPVYWVCLSDAGEHACFLEFNYRMAGRPFDIVDATGLDFITDDGVRAPWSLGLMRANDIVASGLASRRRLFTREEREAASSTWLQLRRENAPLRVLRNGNLVSAQLTCFDAALVAQTTARWEVAAGLIGRTMHHLSFNVDPPGQSPDDVVLFGRVLALGGAGDLDIKGVGPGMRDYEVRRPAP
jgi:hypothetical protein